MKTFLLAENNKIAGFQATLPKKTKIVGWKDFAQSAIRTRDESLWVTEGLKTLRSVFDSLDETFFKQQNELRKRVKLCLIAEVSIEGRRSLEALFKDAIIISQESSLPIEQLLEVLNSKNAYRYVIGGQVDQMTHTLTLIRGDLNAIVIPLSTFKTSGDSIEPDFTNFSIDDYGQTLKFGGYEASVDAVLYEFDPFYRKTRKAELAKKDKSIGASIRRLRLQKGLRQTDFPEIDPREIGRIERGEVIPRKKTIEKIANTLNINSTEIRTY